MGWQRGAGGRGRSVVRGSRWPAVVLVVLVATTSAVAVPGTAQVGHDVTARPPAVQAGASLEILGEGFDLCPGDEFGLPPEVEVTVPGVGGGAPTVRTVQPLADGSWSMQHVVPADAGVGELLVVARQVACERIDRTVVDVFTFAVTPTTAPAGSGVTAVGDGFLHSAECGPVTITFDGEVVAQVEVVGPEFLVGFLAPFVVPERPPGDFGVVATQGDTCSPDPPIPARRGRDDLTIPLDATVPPTPPPTEQPSSEPSPDPSPTASPAPSLELDPPVGTVADTTVVTATGFTAGPVVVSFGDVTTTVPAGVVGDGDFVTPVTVPDAVPGGLVVVDACQQCGDVDERVASDDFVVVPRLLLDPVVGPAGMATTVTGDGFPAGAPLDLAWEPGVGAVTLHPSATGVVSGSVLVLPRDRLGIRELRTSLAPGDLLPAPFEPDLVAALEVALPGLAVAAEYLVVPGTVQPGDFVVRR